MALKRTFVVMVSTLALLVPVLGSSPALAAKVELKNEDCGKCHDVQAADLDAAGGAHKDQGCRECHKGHKPASPKNIPQCSECHEGQAHYKLANCLGCHRNPHTPLKVTFGKTVTDACLTCHKDKTGYVSPGAQLKQFPSKHTQLACSFCHDTHGKKPECTQCHKPHADTMTAKDCSTCHKAHQPLNVTYPATVANAQCGACHKAPARLIAATATRHAKVSCVQCHKDKHKAVPKCSECHQVKHPAGIMAKFPNCLTCHNHPHDLNNFAAKAAAPAAKPAAAPAPAPAMPKQ